MKAVRGDKWLDSSHPQLPPALGHARLTVLEVAMCFLAYTSSKLLQAS